jgi:hypothetical protein
MFFLIFRKLILCASVSISKVISINDFSKLCGESRYLQVGPKLWCDLFVYSYREDHGGASRLDRGVLYTANGIVLPINSTNNPNYTHSGDVGSTFPNSNHSLGNLLFQHYFGCEKWRWAPFMICL